MCGIAGFIYKDKNREAEEKLLRRMLSLIVHRGPDEEGVYVKGNCAIGMRRLNIIDLNTGSQPIFSKDRKKMIVYNGEFYPFKKFRNELKDKYEFYTKTDTEVILHLYEEYGLSFVEKLSGMYAIAIRDESKEKLILVRDRVGIKPLYYSLTNSGTLVFGSEPKTILLHPEVKKEVDPQALELFLSLEYIPAPLSIFKNIRKLPPAHFLVYEDGEVKIKEYWRIENKIFKADEKEYIDEIDRILEKSVNERLISDVPLGAFLSGGVDSSSVVGKMRKIGVDPLLTFSIGFDEKSYNELPFSQKVARLFKTDHYIEKVSPDTISLIKKLIFHLDDPIGDFSIFPTYLVSMIARKRVTVSLSGDGGDELFAGYEHYIAQKISNLSKKIPLLKQSISLFSSLFPPSPKKKGFVNRIKRYSRGLNLPSSLRHFRWMLFLTLEEKERLFSEKLKKEVDLEKKIHEREPLKKVFERAKDFDPINGELYIDFKTYLVDNILVKVDRMSMATSLEARVPILDHNLVEFAFKIPGKYKLKGITTKYIFKKNAERMLPKEIVYREKQGFSIPIKNWLKNELKPLLYDFLSKENIEKIGFFNPREVERLKREHIEGKENHSHILWSLLLFHMWYEFYLVEEKWTEGIF